MLVKAKCITPAWDSDSATRYEPGNGPLLDGLYEIERNGPLASLKLGERYVFDFDRNSGPDDKPHDYTCKRCGKKYKTLPDLGTHTNQDHKDGVIVADSDEEIIVKKDGRGKHSNRTFTCKEPGCGEVLPHLYALKVHKKTHQPTETAVSV